MEPKVVTAKLRRNATCLLCLQNPIDGRDKAGPGVFMSNPWLKKNPFLSMWLSSANRVAGTARGQLKSQVKRQSTAAANKANHDIFVAWSDAMGGAAKPARRKKR
jgi:hypothetical protein